ncbi:MAG TPA: hydrogenase iron-sulfur subunit [Anaerolineales bacterium]|jgi:F420-non-reducing hydrogenase iron-sulfur subunit|nr:hydrogenase iron-sulfur subunit [Anaerolineales bacterium]
MTEPKIIGFLCNWCSYRGADGAGMARLKYPPNVKIIRVPCSGRVAPELVLRTFREGADGVMVLGCHIGDCHYSTGNHRTAKRMPVLKKLLEYSGIDPERLYVNWVSAAEGEKFAAIIKDFTEKIRALPPFIETMKRKKQELSDMKPAEKEVEWTHA